MNDVSLQVRPQKNNERSFTWRKCELPKTSTLNLGGSGALDVSDGTTLLQIPSDSACGTHFSYPFFWYPFFPRCWQKYLVKSHRTYVSERH